MFASDVIVITVTISTGLETQPDTTFDLLQMHGPV